MDRRARYEVRFATQRRVDAGRSPTAGRARAWKSRASLRAVDLLDGCAHFFLLVRGELGVKRKPRDAIAHVFRNGAIAASAAESIAHRRVVQRLVVEYGQNPARLQV